MKLSRRARRSVPVLVALTVMSMLPVGTAVAEHASVPDGTGDMWEYDFAPGFSSPAPYVTDGGIEETTVRHRRTAVRVEADFVELRRIGEGIAFNATVVTRVGETSEWLLRVGPTEWQGGISDHGIDGCLPTGRVDYRDNEVALRIPRVCLGRPRWVKVAFEVEVKTDDGGTITYLDLAGSPANPRDGLVFTERLRRG